MEITKIEWEGSTKTEWENQRASLMGLGNPNLVRFGSSEIATVLGLSPYESKVKLFHNKRGFYVTKKKSLKMTVGNKIEPLIAEIMESFSFDREQMDIDFNDGVKYRNLISCDYFLINSDYPFFLASLDYVTDDSVPCLFTGEYPEKGIIWETKNPAYMAFKSWDGVPPNYYYAQCQQQLAVSGYDKAYIAVLAGSDYPDLFLVERDEKFIKYMNDEVTEFGLTILKAKVLDGLIFEESAKSTPDYNYLDSLKAMLQQLEPTVDGTEATKAFLEEELYAESNTLEYMGDQTDDVLCDRYLKATKLENKLKEVKTLIRNQFTAKMEDFEKLVTETHKVTNRRSKSGRNYFSIK